MSRTGEKGRPAAEKAESYDALVARLEKAVEDLEAGTLGLEPSLERFAEGMALAREAARRLDEAERRIEALVRDAEGNERAEPLPAPGGAER